MNQIAVSNIHQIFDAVNTFENRTKESLVGSFETSSLLHSKQQQHSKESSQER
jgi:hypothetical protein